MTDKTHLLFFVSGKFSLIGTGTEKGQFRLGYFQKVIVGVGAYFKQKSNLAFSYYQTDRL